MALGLVEELDGDADCGSHGCDREFGGGRIGGGDGAVVNARVQFMESNEKRVKSRRVQGAGCCCRWSISYVLGAN